MGKPKLNSFAVGRLQFVPENGVLVATLGNWSLRLQRWGNGWSCALYPLALSSGAQKTREQAVHRLLDSLEKVAGEWAAADRALRGAAYT